MEAALGGVRVLDMGAYGVGPAACGLLGLLGADVVRIEPPSGDGLMFVATTMGGMGTGYIGTNFNKKSIVLNLHDEADRKIAFKLVAWADVLIENRRAGTMKSLGFDYETLEKTNPGLIYISSPAYGQSGPFTHYAGADHYIQAASGFAQLNGKEGGDAELFRYVAYVDMTNTSIILQAALLGLLARERTGRGLHIATSSFNGAIALQATRLAEFFATCAPPRRLGSADPNVTPSQAFRTLDHDYVLVSAPDEDSWARLCHALDLDHLRSDPRFGTNASRVAHRHDLTRILAQAFRDKPRQWWLIHLQRHSVPCGYVGYFDDVVRDPHVLHNHILAEKETPWGKAIYVGAPWKFSRTPALPVDPTHPPGVDRERVLDLLKEAKPRRITPREGSTALPLQGVTVVDLSEGIAGAVCSSALADAGADVIKVEGVNGDWTRRVGPTVNGEGALFVGLNRNKKSLSVDMDSEPGRDVIYRLARRADVFIESYTPGTPRKLTFAYPKLRALRRKLVCCSITPFGEEGPYRERPASELELQGLAGLMQFLGERGQPPVRLGADAVSIVAGIHAASALFAALYHRGRSRVGQKVSVSMLHVALWMGRTWLVSQYSPDTYGGYFVTGPFDHPETGYKTRDRAIMFGLFTSTAERARQTWEQFCARIGLDASGDPYFAEHGPRLIGTGRDAQEMKPVFEKAFEHWRAEDLVETIQSIGGMAATFMTYEELYGDPPHPQVAANDMILKFDHPRAGKAKAIGVPYKLGHTTLGVRNPPPLLGEHTEEILTALGYSLDDIHRLARLGHVKLCPTP